MNKLILILAGLFTLNTATLYAQEIVIPIEGNSFQKEVNVAKDHECNVFFKLEKAAAVQMYLIAAKPQQNQSITCTLASSSKIYSNIKDTTALFDSAIHLKAGYQCLKIKASKFSFLQGKSYLILKPSSDLKEKEVVFVKEEKDFYFGRRGPSVHMRFVPDEKIKDEIQYFYNEVQVPKGMDPIGSYFMAGGFSFGYFGIQVNSKTERRVLFSVWSPFVTDQPKEIPADMQITLLKKGSQVKNGAFGSEGSGGQTYLKFPWEAGKTYGFLLKAQPNKDLNYTDFTAYFLDKSTHKWHLIASLRRPKNSSYLADFYSFVENFNPDMGAVTRKAIFGNQWFGTKEGQWSKAQNAVFTTDATGNAGQRKDYKGGVANSSYFLQMGGFFDDFTAQNTKFKATPSHSKAPILPNF